MVGDYGYAFLNREGRRAHIGLPMGRVALSQPFRLWRGLDPSHISWRAYGDERVAITHVEVLVVLHFVASKLSNKPLGISCTFLKVA